MPIRPQFLRNAGICFAFGLAVIAVFYFQPDIDISKLPQLPKGLCPWLAWLKPLDKSPVQPNDSIELQTEIGDRHEPYTVRIFGDGHIQRDTTMSLPGGLIVGCPLHDVDNHLNIPASQAVDLIGKARDEGFCRLCGIYESRHRGMTGTFTKITLGLHGTTHAVYDFGGSPPPVFAELVRPLKAYISVPEYAGKTFPSRERMIECNQFQNAQIDKMMSTLKH
jgi:hypothetical protein